MTVETAWPNWIDRPILFRLYDLINGVFVLPEDYKQTLIDAANEISDLANEARDPDDNDDGRIETLASSKDYARLEAENAALRERCESAEEAQTHLIYLYDCETISLPETREIVERIKQQAADAAGGE